MRFETWWVSDHPVCAFQRWLRSIGLMAQPPLLFQEGNTLVLPIYRGYRGKQISLNFDRIFARNSGLTSTTVGNLPFSFMS